MGRPRRGRRRRGWRTVSLVVTAVALLALAAPAQERAATSVPETADYRIGVEDVLKIFVLEDELLKAGTLLTVRPDGKINFPYIKGSIVASGRTTEELEDEIAEKLSTFIRAPTVTAIVEEVNSFRVYVLGEVNEPGVIQLRRPVKVLQVLAMARDITEFADKGKLQLARIVDGRDVRYRLDYRKILDGDPKHDLWIRPEDILVVP